MNIAMSAANARNGSETLRQIQDFMAAHVFPNEAEYRRQVAEPGNRWQTPPIMADLKARAKAAGFWNLFLADPRAGGLSNRDYAPLCEAMGHSWMAPEIFNCSAPDTGNMETLHLFGTEAQKTNWLEPLLEGEIRSCFSMTEPNAASSDATNMACTITRDGDDYIVNGRKWWSSGANHQNCRIAIVMGLSNPDAPKHQRHSMILVPLDTPGVTIERSLNVFGYDHAPHGHAEITYSQVRVPASNMLLGEGRGFEIAQARLGPGRIHHCMRLVGVAERALAAMVKRARDRVAFGRPLAEQGALRHSIARSRIEIDQARLLTLHTASLMDELGTRRARREIAMIKAVAPSMACGVIDRAIQVFGAAGISQDTFLADAYARARGLRIADGPDEVHIDLIARMELEGA